MKKLIFVLSFAMATMASLITPPSKANAQSLANPTDKPIVILEVFSQGDDIFDSTESAESTSAGKLASASAQVEQIIQEKKDKDITETGGKQKSKLAAYLDEHPIGSLSWHNPIQFAIRKAIEKGLPANLIVLILLFPVIASMIAASRHVLGLKGFGIYIPAVLSVAFVSTGIANGVGMFVVVLMAAIWTRKFVRTFRMPYLPRTAMLMWGVSIVVLAMMIGSAILLENSPLLSINIFPVLITILLTENFIESQQFNSQKEALKLTIETIFLSIICSIIISNESVQKMVIISPEITLILVAVINYAIGKYSGLRLLEYIRFRSILNNNE